jgi:hypothetical protein
LQSGETVWWVAAPEGGEYYNVPLSYDKVESGRAFCPLSHTGIPSTKTVRVELNDVVLPNLIFLSKPETYDSRGKIGYLLAKNKFTPVAAFKTFVVWRAPAS